MNGGTWYNGGVTRHRYCVGIPREVWLALGRMAARDRVPVSRVVLGVLAAAAGIEMGPARRANAERDAGIVAAVAGGKTVKAVARRHGISESRVYRILSDAGA